jgi:glutathione S-transferase
LYQFRIGTNPRRVIIYLSEKGLDVPRYELNYRDSEHRLPSYLAINPSGRAPTLVTDDGSAITDSAAIVEYLEELHPNNPLMGSDLLHRARVRALERLGTDLIVRCQLWLWNSTTAFPAKEPLPSAETAARTCRYAVEILDALEKKIGENHFLAGETPTVADFTTFPIFQTLRERFNVPMGSEHPRLDTWYRRFRKRPSANY